MSSKMKTKQYTTPLLTVLSVLSDIVTQSGPDVINNNYTDAEALAPGRRSIWDN